MEHVYQSSLVSGQNVRWPGHTLPPCESHRYANGTDRQTDRQMPDHYTTLSAMDMASILISLQVCRIVIKDNGLK